jgi:hypothetical protein
VAPLAKARGADGPRTGTVEAESVLLSGARAPEIAWLPFLHRAENLPLLTAGEALDAYPGAVEGVGFCLAAIAA